LIFVLKNVVNPFFVTGSKGRGFRVEMKRIREEFGGLF
jgi:hypothetical protein